MVFSREEQKEAYEKFPIEVRGLIMSPETTEIIENFLKKIGFSDEQEISADSEILYAMLGLQTLSSAIENIAKLSNKNLNELSGLKEDLEKEIFSKISTENNGNGSFQVVEDKKYQNSQSSTKTGGVGQSFERIILNQARAMQPARAADGADPTGVPTEAAKGYQAPQDLPAQETQPAPTTAHIYAPGTDPYREPIQ